LEVDLIASADAKVQVNAVADPFDVVDLSLPVFLAAGLESQHFCSAG
jgi:hypothetical protein